MSAGAVGALARQVRVLARLRGGAPLCGVMSDDDWETDPDFENDVTEEEQRYGAKTIGFARTDVNMKALAESTKSDFETGLRSGPKYDAGYASLSASLPLCLSASLSLCRSLSLSLSPCGRLCLSGPGRCASKRPVRIRH